MYDKIVIRYRFNQV